jgi:hypothetical protein
MPAEIKNPPSDQDNKDDRQEAPAPQGSKFSLFFKGKWFLQGLVILLILSIAVQAGGWIYYYANSSGKTPPGPEIGLGQYQFTALPPAGGRINQARFSLFVTLLKGLEKSGRETLISHQYRVQQDVEQLLRQVHSGDFEDPDLGGLKIQIREKIDRAIGSRMIADVIITDLKLTVASPSNPPSVAENTAIPVGTIPPENHAPTN